MYRSLSLLLLVLVAGCWVPDRRQQPEPAPPTPVVEPKVDPEPVIEPSPISVLIVEETADRGLPANRAWEPVLGSIQIRQYLDSHCITKDGRPTWRWLDQDADMSDADQFWQDAMKLPRTSLPWIAISNGKSGVSGPLPTSEDATLELLRKWGGP